MDELMLSEETPGRQWSGTVRLIEIADWKAGPQPVSVFPSTVPFQPPMGVGRVFNTAIVELPDGTEQRYEDFGSATGVRQWTVGGDALTKAQANDLLECWEGNLGPWLQFEFTDPISQTKYNAHFVETELVHTLVSPGADGIISSIRLTVEESK